MRPRILLALPLLLVACTTSETPAPPPPSEPPPPAEEEVMPLPEIVGAPVFEDINPDPHIIEVDLWAHYHQVELEAGTLTNVMAYNGSTPGPLLYGRVGDRVIVHFHNELGEPTTVHWHGLRISDTMDGTPRVQDPVEPGESFDYEFVLPDAGTYWYHPHANTIEQLELGLSGAIVVAEAEDEAPVFSSERLVMLDDVRLDSLGQIAPFAVTGHDIVHGREGNVLLTNGHAEPLSGTIEQGAVERWRLVNMANARTMSLSIEGARFRVIGTDGGLLPTPYETTRLEMPVGQRYDLEVSVDAAPGSVVTLTSHVLAVVNNEVVEVPMTIGELKVEGSVEIAPPIYPAVELPPIVEPAMTQDVLLGGYTQGNELIFTINGVPGHMLEDLVFTQGTPVVMKVVNEIGPYHPFHLHGQFFQVLTRDGQPANEPGLKDTVLVNAFEEVTILTYFDNPGTWMYHCHIGSHAEHGMMANLIVTPSAP